MWKKMCISVFFSGNQIFQKKMCVWFFFGLGWWVYQNLGDLLKWTSAQNPTDVAFSSPFSWNKVTKQTIRKKICVEIELNFMRWQEASKKSDDINWHHWDPSWAYPGAWTSVVFLSRKKPIASHSSLHQHSYFSITSASSLAYQHPRLDISRQILVESRDPTIFQNAPLFPTVPSYPARGTRPRGRVCIAKPPQINVIMNEKCLFWKPPSWIQQRLVLTSLTWRTFHTKATLCYPQQKWCHFRVLSVCVNCPSFSFLNCLWISFNKDCAQSRHLCYIFQHQANMSIFNYIYICILFIYIYMHVCVYTY